MDVRGQAVSFQIKELKAPHGQGRVTSPKDWGLLGVIKPKRAGETLPHGRACKQAARFQSC